jgi:hypothetical protein
VPTKRKTPLSDDDEDDTPVKPKKRVVKRSVSESSDSEYEKPKPAARKAAPKGRKPVGNGSQS